MDDSVNTRFKRFWKAEIMQTEKLITFIVSIVSGLLLATSAFAEKLTLEKYLAEVLSANPSVQSQELRAKAFHDRIAPAAALDDPFIAFGIDDIPFGGGSDYVRRYQVSQAIPFPGKLSTKEAIARNKSESSKGDAQTLNREMSVLATQAFYRAYYNQMAIELNGKLKKIISGTVASTKSRYETGSQGHHDLLLAQIELSTLDVDKLRLVREKKTLEALLNELRNQPPDTPLGAVAVKFTNENLTQEDKDALQNQPELMSLDAYVAQAEQEEKLAKLAYYPDFVIQGMAMDPTSRMMNSNWGIMVGVNIPLYAARKQSGLLSAAAKDKEAAMRERSSLENRLKTEVIAAKEQLKTSRDTVSLYKKTVIPKTQLAVENAKASYISGKLPLTDYLDTLKAQRVQELEYLAAQIDVELARTRIRELLSTPPILRLAPMKPSVFGGSGMGSAGMGSDTVSMGSGMSGPTRKPKASSGASESGGGMGGM